MIANLHAKTTNAVPMISTFLFSYILKQQVQSGEES